MAIPGASAAEGLPASTLGWIEAQVGARVTSSRRFPRARDAWWVETGEGSRASRWILKGRRAPANVVARSRFLTDFGPDREAAAMSALAGSGLRVPALGGFDAASGRLLIERVDGSALIHYAPVAERRQAVADYGRELAALHALDWSALSVGPAIAPPTSREDMATGGWLRSAETDAETARPRLRHAEPLLRLLTRWLHDNAPANRGTGDVSLLHGDAGVTNFLSVDGRVTALVDWELALLGDPMSDLGNARYREALYPSGTYPVLIAAYETATGTAVDERAVGYYAALAGTVLSLGMAANVHHPRARQPEAVARLWQDCLARSVACEAVCEIEGVALDYGDLDAGRGTSLDPIAELLSEHLDVVAAEASAGPVERAYARLGRAAQNALRVAAADDEALCQDAAELIGSRPSGPDDARAELDGLVGRADHEQRLRLLVVLARDARRRVRTLSPLRDAEIWEGATGVLEAAPATPTFVLPPLREAVGVGGEAGGAGVGGE